MEPNNQMVTRPKSTKKKRKKTHYVHLIGNAEIRFEDVIVDEKGTVEKRFTIHFRDNEGNILEKVDPLIFAKDNVSIKFLNVHLIAEIWDEQLKDHIDNFKKGSPNLVTIVESEEKSRFGIAPLQNSMTSTDPPKSNALSQVLSRIK